MRNGPFLALCAAVFAAAFGYTAVMPLLPQLLSPMLPQASSVELGWHTGVYAASYMLAAVVFSPLWGAASDRYGRRTIIALGLAGNAGALLAADFFGGIWASYIMRVLQGAFASAIFPVSLAVVAGIADTAERARKVAALGIASLLGFFVAPALSAGMVTLALEDPAAGALYASASAALGALALVRLLPAQQSKEGPTTASVSATVLPWRFSAVNLLAYFGLGAFEVALPLAAPGPFNIGLAQVSLLFAECSLVMLAAQGILMWGSRFGERLAPLLTASMVAYAAGLMLLARAGSFGDASSAVGVIAATSGLVLPLVSYLAMFGSGSRPGAGLGVLSAAGGLGQALGSLTGGALYAYAGMGTFATAASVVVLGVLASSARRAPGAAAEE